MNQLKSVFLKSFFLFVFACSMVAGTYSFGQEASAAPALKPARYVFLFIGDGMSSPQRLMSESFCQSVGRPGLLINSFAIKSSTTTQSANALITDSAASGTAIACGEKTNNGRIGMDPEAKRNLISSAVVARKTGRKVGIITSVTLNHATPAAFYGHQDSRSNYYALGLDLIQSGFDFFGGGAIDQADNRKAPRYKGNLYELAEKAGYKVVHDPEAILALTPDAGKTIACQEEGPLPYAINRQDGLTLNQYTRKGIELLDNPKGFFLMVEGGKIDWVGHANDAPSVVYETIEFDKAVAEAVNFAKKHPEETLIVVTGDHETGGLTLGFAGTGYKLFYERLDKQTCSRDVFRDNLKKMRKENKSLMFDQCKPMVSQSFGFKFDGAADDPMTISGNDLKLLQAGFESDQKNGSLETNAFAIAVFKCFDKKVGLGWTSGGHTALPVITSVTGVDAELFKGNLDNTDVSKKIKQVLQLGF